MGASGQFEAILQAKYHGVPLTYFMTVSSFASSLNMYRKSSYDAYIFLGPMRQSSYLNGTASESSTGRRRLFSQQKSSRASHYPTWPSTDRPTPYEVMGIERGNKYSKSRYYDLVKVYHPDSSTSLAAQKLPVEERLSRYRLIVDAHEILSDYKKRSAYDTYGLGWPLPSRPHSFDLRSQRHTTYDRWGDEGFNGGSERELIRRLFRNKKFICFVVVLVTFAQTCVILSSLAKSELQMRRTDEECRDMIYRHRDRALSLKTLMAQMERLLLKRDPSGMGLASTEEPFYRDMLPFCAY